MNTLDKQYQDLLSAILEHGVVKQDRTGTGTISIFGYTVRHNMKQGFPILTTKKVHFKSVVSELLWFLQGRTDLRWLLEQGNTIWVGDAYRAYTNHFIGHEDMPSKEWFINEIKTNDKFANKWGSLGKIYGYQWRNWGEWKVPGPNGFSIRNGVDQIANLINELKTNPDSRRMIVNAWSVQDLPEMILPPCHYGFQVYTRNLSLEERRELVIQEMFDKVYTAGTPSTLSHSEIDQWNVPTRAISLMWNQRSVDTPLGLPFNIASYGLLLEIIAKIVNMVPDELIGNLGDCHIYLNQIDGCREQIGRKYKLSERMELWEQLPNRDVMDFPIGPLTDSQYHDVLSQIGIPRTTRDSYRLPKLVHVKNNEFYLSLSEHLSLLTHLEVIDFQLKEYASHPSIKFPLSN